MICLEIFRLFTRVALLSGDGGADAVGGGGGRLGLARGVCGCGQDGILSYVW